MNIDDQTIDQTVDQGDSSDQSEMNSEIDSLFDKATASDDESQQEGAKKESTVNDDAGDTDDTESADGENYIEPPRSWTKSMRESWDDIDPETQKIISERETMFMNRFSEQGRALSYYEPVGKTIQKYGEVFQQMQAHPAEVMDGLMANWVNLHHNPAETLQHLARTVNADIDHVVLGRNPVQSIHRLAQKAGIDLLDLALCDAPAPAPAARQQQYPQSEQQQDPRLAQMQARVAMLEDALRQEYAQRPQQPDPVDQYLHATVNYAAEQYDDFDDLAPMIAPLIPQVREQNPHLTPNDWLTIAYERAAEWRDSQAGRVAERRMQQDQTRNDRASRAAAANVRGNGVSSGTPAMSMQQEIDQAWSKLGMR